MKHLVKIIYVVVFIVNSSCSIRQTIIGKYIYTYKSNKNILAAQSIELNSDSTFTYNFMGGFRGKVSTGLWKADKDNKRIIINSFIQDIRNIPVVVTETKSNNNSFPLFVFDNPLKLDTFIKWALNVNDIDYPLNTDSLVLDKGIIVKKFYLTGYISFKDSTYRAPFPLQDTIQSKKYNVKDSNNNVYHITFPVFVNYDIFHYKPLHDSFTLNRKTLWFEGIKLKKK